MKNKITTRKKILNINVNDMISTSESLQLGGYGRGQNGGQKIGGRRTNWFKNKNTQKADEIDVARRFSLLTENRLTKFENEYEENSDIDVYGRSNNGQIVENFQITSLWNNEFWKELSDNKATDQELNSKEIANLILVVMKKKGEKYTLSRRKTIILLIDTNPASVIPELVDGIKNCLGTQVSDFGFKGVWLVGTDKEHTFKL